MRINEFHSYLRPIHRPHLDWHLAQWRMLDATSVVTCEAREVVDYILQGLTEGSDARAVSLSAAVKDMRKAGEAKRYTATPFGQVYGQSFQLYNYCCLSKHDPNEWPTGPFKFPIDRLLFEMATCHRHSTP